MDLSYDVRQVQSEYNRQSRQHHHHEDHGEPAVAQPAEDSSTEHSCGHGGHGGAMIFHVGDSEMILFDWWHTSSTLTLLLSCLVVFIVAMLYEALKSYREWLKKCEKKRLEGGGNRSSQKYEPQMPTSLLDEFSLPLPLEAAPAPEPAESPRAGRKRCAPWLTPRHWYQTLLHMLQVTISFILMLIFMTFNVWLCIAVVLGAGFGYFIFFARTENVSEHCN